MRGSNCEPPLFKDGVESSKTVWCRHLADLLAHVARVLNRTAAEVEKYLHRTGITIYGEDLPWPCESFDDIVCLPEVAAPVLRIGTRGVVGVLDGP